MIAGFTLGKIYDWYDGPIIFTMYRLVQDHSAHFLVIAKLCRGVTDVHKVFFDSHLACKILPEEFEQVSEGNIPLNDFMHKSVARKLAWEIRTYYGGSEFRHISQKWFHVKHVDPAYTFSDPTETLGDYGAWEDLP